MKKILYSLLATCLFLACKTAYVPNTLNVPLFDGSGQMRLSGDLSGNVQFAASLAPKFGIMVNGMWKKDGENTDAVSGKGHFYEAGLGTFNTYNDIIRYEAYIGAGIGQTMSRDNGKSFEAKGSRVFFQPSIGIHQRIFEIAFTPRLVAGKFQRPDTDFTTQQLIADKLSEIDKPTWIFLEPALTARVGYQWLKLQLQLGKSFKLNKQDLAYKSDLNSVGIIFDLGRKEYR
ncbi:MAG: hypothetical protein ABI844_00100 [Saprospiraceae bacterium]